MKRCPCGRALSRRRRSRSYSTDDKRRGGWLKRLDDEIPKNLKLDLDIEELSYDLEVNDSEIHR